MILVLGGPRSHKAQAAVQEVAGSAGVTSKDFGSVAAADLTDDCRRERGYVVLQEAVEVGQQVGWDDCRGPCVPQVGNIELPNASGYVEWRIGMEEITNIDEAEEDDTHDGDHGDEHDSEQTPDSRPFRVSQYHLEPSASTGARFEDKKAGQGDPRSSGAQHPQQTF